MLSIYRAPFLIHTRTTAESSIFCHSCTFHIVTGSVICWIPPFMVFTITFMISVHKDSEVHSWSGRFLLQVSPETESTHIEIQWIPYWFEVILTVHRQYVEIKGQLDATDVFYCRSYCLLNMFQAPLCPSSGAREYYTVGCCLSYLVFKLSVWCGAEGCVSSLWAAGRI